MATYRNVLNIRDDSQREEMSAQAHRRPYPKVGSPSISWHLAFWRPKLVEEKELWWKLIDANLAALFERLHFGNRGESVCENFTNSGDTARLSLFRYAFGYKLDGADYDRSEPTPLAHPQQLFRHDQFCYTFRRDGVWITVFAELHTEYWTLTTVLDFSETEIEQKIVGDAKLDHLRAYLRLIEDFTRRHCSGDTDEAKSVFPKIRTDLIEAARDYIYDLLGAREIRYDLSGGLFANPMGIVLGVRPSSGAIETAFEPLRPHDARTKSPQQHIDDRISYTPEQATVAVAAVWPVVRLCQKHYEHEPLYGKPAYAASMFQGRRAIYLSTLGGVMPAVGSFPQLSEYPILYFILTPHQNRWQLGRMVGHLHTLGTLRLAAIRDFANLVLVHKKIRRVQRKLTSRKYDEEGRHKELEADLYAVEVDDEHLTKDGDELENNEWLSGVGAYLCGEGFKETEVAANLSASLEAAAERESKPAVLIPAGIQYRAERSVYYVSRFREILKKLRPSRIEGYMTYEQLVSHRMDGTFKVIETTGSRYKSLRDEVWYYRADSQQRVTNALLSNADKALFLIVWYYSTGVLEELGTLWAKRPYFYVPKLHWTGPKWLADLTHYLGGFFEVGAVILGGVIALVVTAMFQNEVQRAEERRWSIKKFAEFLGRRIRR